MFFVCVNGNYENRFRQDAIIFKTQKNILLGSFLTDYEITPL